MIQVLPPPSTRGRQYDNFQFQGSDINGTYKMNNAEWTMKKASAYFNN